MSLNIQLSSFHITHGPKQCATYKIGNLIRGWPKGSLFNSRNVGKDNTPFKSSLFNSRNVWKNTTQFKHTNYQEAILPKQIILWPQLIWSCDTSLIKKHVSKYYETFHAPYYHLKLNTKGMLLQVLLLKMFMGFRRGRMFFLDFKWWIYSKFASFLDIVWRKIEFLYFPWTPPNQHLKFIVDQIRIIFSTNFMISGKFLKFCIDLNTKFSFENSPSQLLPWLYLFIHLIPFLIQTRTSTT